MFLKHVVLKDKKDERMIEILKKKPGPLVEPSSSRVVPTKSVEAPSVATTAQVVLFFCFFRFQFFF